MERERNVSNRDDGISQMRPEIRGIVLREVEGGYEILRDGGHLTVVYYFNGLLYELAEVIAKLERDMVSCSCEKWKACARHATGKCRICDGTTYFMPKD